MTNIYEYMKNYLVYQQNLNEKVAIDISSNPIIYETIIAAPLDIFLREIDMNSRQEIFEFLIKNREYKTIRFMITKYYSIYLLCHGFP